MIFYWFCELGNQGEVSVEELVSCAGTCYQLVLRDAFWLEVFCANERCFFFVVD